jgi:pyruvate/2-oxoglutarate dehydrogenase complex dihydrolipoamide dehydrogenase (E3) component
MIPGPVAPAYDYDLVCIGSGPAGQRAAVQAAKLGKRVAVLEKQRCVGGVCTSSEQGRLAACHMFGLSADP